MTQIEMECHWLNWILFFGVCVCAATLVFTPLAKPWLCTIVYWLASANGNEKMRSHRNRKRKTTTKTNVIYNTNYFNYRMFFTHLLLQKPIQNFTLIVSRFQSAVLDMLPNRHWMGCEGRGQKRHTVRITQNRTLYMFWQRPKNFVCK